MILKTANTLSPAQMAGDILQLTDLYERVHPCPLTEFPVRKLGDDLSLLKDRLSTPLSRMEFYRILAPIVNGTGDEHTHMLLPAQDLKEYSDQGGFFFPFDIGVWGGQAYISSFLDNKDYEIPRGAELLAINSRPMTEILKTLKGFFSGTSENQQIFFLETSFPEAHYLGYGSSDNFKVSFKVGDDPALKELTIQGCPIVEKKNKADFPILNVSPLRVRIDNHFQRMGKSAILLDFIEFQNPSREFDILLDKMFEIAKIEARNLLIIDMRRNLGGNSFVAKSLLSYFVKNKYFLLESSELHASEELKRHFLSFIPPWLRALGIQYIHPWTSKLWRAKKGEMVSISFKPIRPGKKQGKRFNGKVIFLTGPGDYSSSAILLGTIKHYKLGTIVGEPSGGYPTHYGNCIPYTLENSQLKVLIPASINHGLGTGPVLPDHEIRISPEDMAEGRDTVIEYALSLTP
ncbi:MAG: hypothetical protein JEZ06_10700 [Anaerolineaceae bacterium]|nr:hypothetical protein [Anaerolineaceae bacterium]